MVEIILGGIPIGAVLVKTAPPHNLTPEQDALLDEIAAGIRRRELVAPALLLLESVRPLNFVASQLMHGLGPMVSLFVSPARWTQFAEALEERETLGVLMSKIEAGGREPSAS